ncbi:hypothetical protein BO94DRAFT_474966 [Aspergillus sclerotioniger CBS 115572]|uniref:rRNA-processing protein EFG1 n=1 Tax=Aspergillus sclerotioniger CBS 115572 TaxID=1450535 RepID=A0A317VLS6_9EURO|nr:hypothetical protein BO94DRAFT_474966 [Aspergillus sclerotioniger CBS 115572]PWY73822.1 hypothetical protein BO94DRAFT_474966 [Aspergillus sclerotioniger CBS 115572]
MTGANRIAKRKTRDFDLDNTTNPDTTSTTATAPQQTQTQDKDQGHARKKIHLHKKEHKYPSVNELKKRIRDVKRLLNKADLPADARIVQERALKGYENDLEEELKRRDRSKMIKKYHFVRFLDRKTASKDISRLTRREKEITSSSTLESKEKERKLKALAEKLHVARVNLNYTIYYPLSEKYIALYAEQRKKTTTTGGKGDGEDSDDDARFGPIHATVAEKPGMWHVVEKCMAEGTLDELRDGKMKVKVDGEDATGEKKQKVVVKEGKKNSAAAAVKEVKSDRNTKGWERVESGRSERSKRRAAAREDYARRNAAKDDGEESDGGFFEM